MLVHATFQENDVEVIVSSLSARRAAIVLEKDQSIEKADAEIASIDETIRVLQEAAANKTRRLVSGRTPKGVSKDAIATFLKSRNGSGSVTQDIVAGTGISKATVYRSLSELLTEGRVRSENSRYFWTHEEEAGPVESEPAS